MINLLFSHSNFPLPDNRTTVHLSIHEHVSTPLTIAHPVPFFLVYLPKARQGPTPPPLLQEAAHDSP